VVKKPQTFAVLGAAGRVEHRLFRPCGQPGRGIIGGGRAKPQSG
jgi:hypothetical protein